VKKIIKNIIIFLFGEIKRSRRSRCLFYHDIHSYKKYTDMSTTIDMLEKHIKTIRENGFEIVKEITKEDGEIAISFDDGWAGVYDNIELINRLEVPITIFVITSLIGSENYMREEQIIELNKSSLINFQSHTHTHPDLPLLTEEELVFELSESKNILEKICNKDIDSICFPRGLFSIEINDIAKNVGYKKQYSSLPGAYSSEVFPSVKRRSLVQFFSSIQLKSVLRGGDDLLFNRYYKKHFKR